MCPRCGHEFVCGCGSKVCKESGRGKQRWPWINGEVEACGHCGLQASADQWFEEQMYSISDREACPIKHPQPSLSDYLFRPGKKRLAA